MKEPKPYMKKVLDKVNTIVGMFVIARKNSEGQKLEQLLSSAVIYTSVAEFLTFSILEFVEFKRGMLISEQQREKMNIGSLAFQLRRYKFDYKEELLPILYQIRDARNKLFHEFIESANKDEVDKYVKIIRSNTEDLLELWSVITHIIIRGLESDSSGKYEKLDKEIGVVLAKKSIKRQYHIIDFTFVDAHSEEEALERAKKKSLINEEKA